MSNGTVPKRRWLQFRLSTVLLVIAISCWALATRPFWLRENQRVVVSKQEFMSPKSIAGRISGGRIEVNDEDRSIRVYSYNVERSKINPGLRWPVLALIALLIWKGARLGFQACINVKLTH